MAGKKEFLWYRGKTLVWVANHKVVDKWPASSGHDSTHSYGKGDFQTPAKQCVPFDGPIPEGVYRLESFIVSRRENYSVVDGSCNLNRGPGGIQQVTGIKKKGIVDGGSCIELWGPNRVRLVPHDKVAENACNGRRNGFYIHDSSKGNSSGCIEIGPGFFQKLRIWTTKHNPKNSRDSRRHMLLLVKYKAKSTRGKTLK